MEMKTLFLYFVVLIAVLLIYSPVKSAILGESATEAPIEVTPTPTPIPTETPSPTATPSSSKVNNKIILTKDDPYRGSYLTDPDGFPLYHFDRDTPNRGHCENTCLKKWNPYRAKGNQELPPEITIIKRPDGINQYAYKSFALYRYVNDLRPEDMTGDGADGMWRLARP